MLPLPITPMLVMSSRYVPALSLPSRRCAQASSATRMAAQRAACDEPRGAPAGIVERPPARDEPRGGPGVAEDASAAAVALLLHRRGLYLDMGDRVGRGGGLPRCQLGCRGDELHARACRRIRCGSTLV